MEQMARVKEVHSDGTAVVSIVRESACSGDCHKCSGCGAVTQTLLVEAVNIIDARPGELVKIESQSGPVLAGAAVLYLIPLGLFFLGYLVGDTWGGFGAIAGCLAFVLGIAAAVLYDRAVARKRDTVYTVTGYPAGESRRKGDHGLD